MDSVEIRGSGRTLFLRLAGARPWLCRVAPAVAVLCFLGWCYVSMRPGFSWDDADPEILNQAWRLAQGKDIYRGIDAPPFTFAAYTPLYYALVALLLKITGLSFLPARLISLLSALAIAWAMVHLSRQWHRSAHNGLWTACFFFLIPAVLYNATRSHAQMMAVALSIWSLVLFLRHRWMATVIVSPLLAVLAFYTKQTQVALPLAMIAYLAVRNRRWLLPYMATGAIAGLIPLLWLQHVSHGNFLLDTVQLARLAYLPWQIPQVLIHHAGPIFLFIALAVHLLWKRFQEGSWEPIDFYLAIVSLTTLVSLGRLGAHGQYVLELLAVTLIFLLRHTGLPAIRGRDLLVSVQVLLLFLYAPLFVFVEEGLWNRAANRAAVQIYPLLQSGSGPILSQQGSFPLFSRGEIYLQLFHFNAMSRAGLWDQGLLLREIEKQTFSWVITEFPIAGDTNSDTDWERFTPEILNALRRNYDLRRAIYPYYLYTPRCP